MSIRALLVAALPILLVGIAYPQSSPVTCATTAVNPVVHAEGIAEPLGDIVISCSGGIPGTVVSLNLAVFLNVGVTNHVTANGFTDALLTIDTGSGPVPSMILGLRQSINSVSFNGVSFVIPASRAVALRVTNLRGNVSQLGPNSQQNILATVSINNGTPSVLSGNTDQLSIGLTIPGLLATLSDTGIRCTGSPLPSEINFNKLLARGTRFVSTRVTEGFASSFEKRAGTADNGIRIVARYAGLPAGARLFVPDAVAGSDAAQPTAAGDFGGTPSGGAYAPGGSGSLLLTRVFGTDANGAGGTLAFTPGAPGSGTVSFNGVSEVTLTNGAGVAVYEVVDADPNAFESAQFPTFLGLAPITDGSALIASEDVSLGPISTVFTASTSDPVPRFLAVAPASDCPALNDCNADYFPALSVSADMPLEFTAPAGSAFQRKTVRINNIGGGLLSWTATFTGVTGSGWLAVSPSSGFNGSSILVDVFPQNLTPGIYTATLLIDGGPVAGSKTLPIKATITNGLVFPIPPGLLPSKVVIRSLTSAARPDSTALAPGALAYVSGSHFKGSSVSVTFDSVAAPILGGADDFLTVQIPESLSPSNAAQLQVVVDGEKSAVFPAIISELAPAIFPTAIYNQDWSANSPSNPATVGSTLQILATGLKNVGAAPVVVKLHDRTLTPSLAGPAPGLVGIGYVGVVLPKDLPAMTTYFFLCGFGSANPELPVCSQAVAVTLK